LTETTFISSHKHSGQKKRRYRRPVKKRKNYYSPKSTIYSMIINKNHHSEQSRNVYLRWRKNHVTCSETMLSSAWPAYRSWKTEGNRV
jgi:hypothetical protein